MYPLISIIISCFNDAEYIEQSVLSALNQTYPNKEIIIVDDGSDILTKDVLKKLEPKISKLITQKNQGQSVARNKGIEKANGEYILILDSDDYFEATFCEKAIPIFFEKEDVKLITCQANLIFDNGSKQKYIPLGGDIQNFTYTSGAIGNSIFKKKDWISCGGYDETMRKGYEDWEFFIRLLKNGGSAHVIQEPLFNYRKKSVSTSSLANVFKYELLNFIYVKHKELYIDDYENFVCHLLCKTEKEEKEKFKIIEKIDYQLGTLLLMPIRFIRNIFK